MDFWVDKGFRKSEREDVLSLKGYAGSDGGFPLEAERCFETGGGQNPRIQRPVAVIHTVLKNVASPHIRASLKR